ncbi:Gfo/Idh/MocA family protein [Pantoea latae]|uniref:Oxidoreductase n=1 Tax=Pantoea latae TaxID=1964541 RepID=A0A1V9DJE5_9GAMM|nr:Gfo/Idh/MocA family oxidoreductase [Pantoea latae]OQP33966.1 oxidoreductase [Pantoea latae]
MTRPLNIAFLGGGVNSAIGQTHKIASQMDGEFVLVAGCFSRDAQINHATAEAWGIAPARVYASSEALLAAEYQRLDAVVILTPTPNHEQDIINCLDAGVTVICEKALVDSVASAKKVSEALLRTGGRLFVTYNYSGYPMVRELRQRIAAGELGNIQQILVEMPQEGFIRCAQSGEVARPQAWRQADSIIPTLSLDLGVHIHQLVDFIAQRQAIDVYAVHSHFSSLPNIIDTVHAVSRYEGGLVCQYWYGKSALGYRNGLRIRVLGDKGSAEWLQMEPESLKLTNTYGKISLIDRTDHDNHIAHHPRYCRFKAGHPAGFIEAFANYYVDIAHALRGDQNSYCQGITTALAGLLFLETAHASATLQRKVDFICEPQAAQPVTEGIFE